MNLGKLFGVLGAHGGSPPPAATVTVTAASISNISTTTSALSISGIRVNSNGTIHKRDGNTYTQINPSTDWIDTPGAAPGLYECRITNVVWTEGGAFTAAAAAEDVWIPVTSSPEWYTQDTAIKAAFGIKDVTFDLEIRYGSSGGALDSGEIGLYSEWEGI